jgi:hypothetical protein
VDIEAIMQIVMKPNNELNYKVRGAHQMSTAWFDCRDGEGKQRFTKEEADNLAIELSNIYTEHRYEAVKV